MDLGNDIVSMEIDEIKMIFDAVLDRLNSKLQKVKSIHVPTVPRKK